jgi:poly(U)-specific endoribonuclease
MNNGQPMTKNQKRRAARRRAKAKKQAEAKNQAQADVEQVTQGTAALAVETKQPPQEAKQTTQDAEARAKADAAKRQRARDLHEAEVAERKRIHAEHAAAQQAPDQKQPQADDNRPGRKQQLEFQQVMKQMAAADCKPTASELGNLSAACSKLWQLDFNRLTPDVHYRLNVQRGHKPYAAGDSAPDPLFDFVDQYIFFLPTFKTFYALLDNYERETGTAEIVTRAELEENRAFIQAVLATPVMKYVHSYLVTKGKAKNSLNAFGKQLDDLWFKLYRREGANDSSGFEHVFVGEDRDGKVMGMHNWIQLYVEERRGNLDYRGYIFPRKRTTPGPDSHEQLLTMQFAWVGDLKPVSTSFIGVSPEFELALYTLCFLCGQEKNRVQLGGHDAQVTCYKFRSGRNTTIGTSFPEVHE